MKPEISQHSYSLRGRVSTKWKYPLYTPSVKLYLVTACISYWDFRLMPRRYPKHTIFNDKSSDYFDRNTMINIMDYEIGADK